MDEHFGILGEYRALLSDDEFDKIVNLFHGASLFDGVMSLQSQKLKDAFGASGFNMTQLWALTPQTWVCPCCNRSKPEIVRVDKNNELSCWIVDHHDHMQELLKKRFFEISSSLNEIVADRDAEDFAKRSSSMVSSFDNVAVCGDCNNVDAKAKKLVRAHPYFSFSPFEIKEFVIARPNLPHEINTQVAQRIWNEHIDTFKLRLKIVDRIAQIAATNQHWFQKVSITLQPDYFYSFRHQIGSRIYDLLTGPKKECNPPIIRLIQK